MPAKIYGHRGARGELAENTIAGFLHAAAAGVAGVETDIALTADLVPVLHHDPTLPDGRLIRDVARAALPDVPSLAEALAAVPEIEWLLEVKTYPDAPGLCHQPDVIMAAVAAVLAAAGLAPARISILAFDWRVLEECRRLDPRYRLVCLSQPAQEAARKIWWGAGYDGLATPAAVAQFGASAWAARHDGLTEALISQATGLGLGVLAWTVNRPAARRRLDHLVDGLITDYPTRLLAPPRRRAD